ncbi:hypothetical protein [Halarcobacter sp.]|uniref:hypothetical protein n=1 Tax=Halarcobacter sp. TaxID=2321133 RepID=UPI0029F5ABD0|nr:hypothetical protein [Halarcobacter sp.]
MIGKLTIYCLGVLFFTSSLFALNEPHTVKILETKNAGAYTYIKVEENNDTYWAAISKSNVKVGQTITIHEQVWMKEFKSKALDKTFDKILFAQIPKKGVSGSDNIHNIHGNMIKKKQSNELKPNPKFNEGIIVSNSEAIKTNISDLFTNKEKYKNKNVEIEGDVLQVSNKVMGNTWVKIYNGKDAVIFRSTNEDEKVSIGDKVKVIGTINTDVDYGYGFKYEVIGVNGKFTILN